MNIRPKDLARIREDALLIAARKLANGCRPCADAYINLARRNGAREEEIRQISPPSVQLGELTATSRFLGTSSMRRGLIRFLAISHQESTSSLCREDDSRAVLMFPVSAHVPWTWAPSSCVLVSRSAPTATPTGSAKRGFFTRGLLNVGGWSGLRYPLGTRDDFPVR